MAEVPDLDDSVHVWRVSLATCPPEARRLLSADEHERADRFHFAHDRDRFVAARAALRRVLAGYLHCAPDDLRFAYSAHGKPSVPELAFNLAHSNQLALVAVTRGREIGIDLEWHRPELELASIARVSFSAAEQSALSALPPAEQAAAFFRIWARKEAYIKARGEGLSMPLDGFSVSLDDVDDVDDVDLTTDDPDESARWEIRAIAIDPGYSAALAVSAPCPPLVRRALPAS